MFYILSVKVENFKVVASNSSNIPCYTIDSIYDKETSKLKEIFNEINTKFNILDNSENNKLIKNIPNGIFGPTSGGYPINYGGLFNTTGYILINNNISFNFDNSFKIIIRDFLKPYFDKENIYITKITNVYFKLNNKDIVYIFNAQFLNSTNFTSRNLVIKLKIKNIQEFIDIIDIKLLSYNTKILFIELNKNDDNSIEYKTKYNPSVTLTPNFYNIKNKLYLMDPFITSSKEMVIDNEMKINFNKSVVDHSKTLSGLIKKNF